MYLSFSCRVSFASFFDQLVEGISSVCGGILVRPDREVVSKKETSAEGAVAFSHGCRRGPRVVVALFYSGIVSKRSLVRLGWSCLFRARSSPRAALGQLLGFSGVFLALVDVYMVLKILSKLRIKLSLGVFFVSVGRISRGL